jgi:hypothetical protein
MLKAERKKHASYVGFETLADMTAARLIVHCQSCAVIRNVRGKLAHTL